MLLGMHHVSDNVCATALCRIGSHMFLEVSASHAPRTMFLFVFALALNPPTTAMERHSGFGPRSRPSLRLGG